MRTASPTSIQQPKRPKRCDHWQAILLSCYSLSASSAPACWRSRCWPARPPTACPKSRPVRPGGLDRNQPPDLNGDLQPGLQYHVEGRFGGAADAFKAALHDYLLETRLACLRAERKANLLRERGRGTDNGRCRIKQCTERVEIVFEPVVGERLDNHPGAVWRQRRTDVTRRAGRVAHVVKAIEKADE